MQISKVLAGLSCMVFLHHSCQKGWLKSFLRQNLTLMGRFKPFQAVTMENTCCCCLLLLLEVPVKVCQDMYRGLCAQQYGEVEAAIPAQAWEQGYSI